MNNKRKQVKPQPKQTGKVLSLNETTGQTGKVFDKGCLTSIILIIIIFISLFMSCSSIFTYDSSGEISDIKLRTIAEIEVEKVLKSPSSAKFSPFPEDYIIRQDKNDESIYTISSFVDAQNSFGAMIRSNFQVKIQMLDNENYKVLYINVE